MGLMKEMRGLGKDGGGKCVLGETRGVQGVRERNG